MVIGAGAGYSSIGFVYVSFEIWGGWQMDTCAGPLSEVCNCSFNLIRVRDF